MAYIPQVIMVHFTNARVGATARRPQSRRELGRATARAWTWPSDLSLAQALAFDGREGLASLLEDRFPASGFSDKTSRLRPRHVAPKPAQAYEPEVPVEMREWIAPASPDLVLEAQPPAHPRRRIGVERPIRLAERPSISIAPQTRLVASAAISVEPEPAKGSRTISSRSLTSSRASSSSARGLTVGWRARLSRASDPIDEAPG